MARTSRAGHRDIGSIVHADAADTACRRDCDYGQLTVGFQLKNLPLGLCLKIQTCSS
jgi:hypothetical protein